MFIKQKLISNRRRSKKNKNSEESDSKGKQTEKELRK